MKRQVSKGFKHGLWTPGEEIAFTAWPKINSQSQIFRYGQRIFSLPHRPKFSGFFDLRLHWVSVVRATNQPKRKGINSLCPDKMRHFSFLLDLFLTKNIDVRGPDQSRTLSQPPFYEPSKLVVNHTMESKPFRGRSQTTLTRRGG